jgi:hypothetical protein
MKLKQLFLVILLLSIFSCKNDSNRESNAADEAKEINLQIKLIEQQLNAYISQKIDANSNEIIQKNLLNDTTKLSDLNLENKFLVNQRAKLLEFHKSFEPYCLTEDSHPEKQKFIETDATKDMTDDDLLLMHQSLKTDLMQIDYTTKELLRK